MAMDQILFGAVFFALALGVWLMLTNPAPTRADVRWYGVLVIIVFFYAATLYRYGVNKRMEAQNSEQRP